MASQCADAGMENCFDSYLSSAVADLQKSFQQKIYTNKVQRVDLGKIRSCIDKQTVHEFTCFHSKRFAEIDSDKKELKKQRKNADSVRSENSRLSCNDNRGAQGENRLQFLASCIDV